MWPYTARVGPAVAPPSRPTWTKNARWDEMERGYSAIQSTRPQTLGYGLNDSPAGLAAWILEKWRSWTDSDGDLDARFGARRSADHAHGLVGDRVDHLVDAGLLRQPVAPDADRAATTGSTCRPRWRSSPHEFVPEGEPPREWYERLYNIRRWTVFPRGGHFAAAEEPDLLGHDIAEFFADLP